MACAASADGRQAFALRNRLTASSRSATSGRRKISAVKHMPRPRGRAGQSARWPLAWMRMRPAGRSPLQARAEGPELLVQVLDHVGQCRDLRIVV